MITWTESPIILEPMSSPIFFGIQPSQNKGRYSNHNEGLCWAPGYQYMHQDRCLWGMTTRLKRDMYMVDGKKIWVDMDSFCSALHQSLLRIYIYIYSIQRSLWYKKYFAWPASCSRLQPVFVGSCFKKNNTHKRAIHRRNLLTKKFIQPKSINPHQPTKINQPRFTNQNQPNLVSSLP